MPYDPVHVATYYAALFPARMDVYSVWTDDGWRPVRETLTPEIVVAGLTGKGPSISGYMIAPGSVSHSLAVDFDIDDGFAVGMDLARAMGESGISAYVETSRRGSHLWCVLDRVLPAVAIRAALRGLLQSIGHDGNPKIELRPGSDTIDAEWDLTKDPPVAVGKGVGHSLRLPLMPHPVTGQRGRLFDANGVSIGRTVAEVLLAIDYAPADALLAWAERWRRPPISFIPPDLRLPHEDYPEDTSTASELLRDLWGVQNAAPGRSVRCPAHEDKMPSLSILRDDRRAICKAGYCILNNDDRGRGTYELRKLAPTTHG